MPVAKRAILDCHAVAKGISSVADAARCHVIVQAFTTVYANDHAIGFPMYDLTAMIREKGTVQFIPVCKDGNKKGHKTNFS